ncbi:hypothetical protein Rruber_05119 (plasmid) [Rhodococcus ruber]|uniref:hypothetical protein n=1 Tax=Rhodococcus ruber TaxID=1830 RepID=UPI00315D5E06
MYAALSDEYVERQGSVRHFARTVPEPRATDIGRRNEYPEDTFTALLAEVVFARTLWRD